jgi:PAS domain-containing protein
MTQLPPRAAGALDDPSAIASMVRRLGAALYVSDAEGRLLDASAGLADMLGVPDGAALRGRALDDWVAEPSARRAALGVLSPDGPARSVAVTLRGAGRAARAVETVAAVRGADGTVQLHGLLAPLSDAPVGAAPARDPRHPENRDVARDPLTGCLERTHVHALGERLARDPATPVGVVIVRLEAEDTPPDDHDVMRQLTARFLMRQVRGNEPVIRLGDDEFLVVLGGASAEQVERVARRVQLLALRGAPGPLSLGWAARERGESLPAVVARASAQRVPVPVGEGGQHRRAGEDPVPGLGAPLHAVHASR